MSARAPRTNVDDATIGRRLVAYLKKRGATREKAIAHDTRVPLPRVQTVLKKLEASGKATRVADGEHRGKSVLAWSLPESATPVRTTYGGSYTLHAFQEAARARLAGAGQTLAMAAA